MTVSVQGRSEDRSPNPVDDSPLRAFTGGIAPTRISLLYRIGLVVVAFAMILLPAIYAGLILLVGFGVLYHLTHNLDFFNAAGNGTIALILYVGPAVVGGTLVAFMIKPFFARRPTPPQPLSLNPAEEPLLFGFIQRICSLVRAPMPCRVDVNCQVNASASLRRGLFSKDLVLTIGLPLTGGLDMRQFAGVLAHEFGHFAQGAGMRLTYVVRTVNIWFARVVYERDQWDLKLERSARKTDIRIAVVLHAARGCVWITRRILWALMRAGQAISCFMLRQMEYDADSYEAKVAGSDSFESTMSRLHTLNLATQSAYNDARQSWTSQRLPEDLPSLIQHKSMSLPAEILQKLRAEKAARKTKLFDTHPCDNDRAQAAARLNEAGVFRLTAPATGLFSNFSELCRSVTRHHYEKDLKLQFTDENLVGSEQAFQESAARSEGIAAIEAFYGKVSVDALPLMIADSPLPPVLDAASLTSQWRDAKTLTERLRPAAEKAAAECGVARRRAARFTSAVHLTQAGFKVNPKEFELPEHCRAPAEQRAAAESRLAEASAAVIRSSAALGPFIAAMRTRVTCALQLLQSTEVASRIPDAATLLAEVQGLSILAGRLGKVFAPLHELGQRSGAFTLLLHNRQNHSMPIRVDSEISGLAGQLRGLLNEIQAPLRDVDYPYSHARGKLTVAEFAQSAKPAKHEWEGIFHTTNSNLENLSALHFRVLGQLLVIARKVETALT